MFKPPQASATLINVARTIHCTTIPVNAGVLGLVFVQKRPLITQLKIISDNPTSQNTLHYARARKKYIEPLEFHVHHLATKE
jgi:hypothetical protein